MSKRNESGNSFWMWLVSFIVAAISTLPIARGYILFSYWYVIAILLLTEALYLIGAKYVVKDRKSYNESWVFLKALSLLLASAVVYGIRKVLELSGNDWKWLATITGAAVLVIAYLAINYYAGSLVCEKQNE